MKIHFEQSGGFVAGVNRPAVSIDTATLPQEEAEAWHKLVNAANFFELPATSAPGPARDAFSFRITVQGQGKEHTVQTQGGFVPPVLSPLIEELRRRGLPGGK